MAGEPGSRAKALELLRSQHDFPGEFEFRVVIRPVHRGRALTAVTAAAGGSHTLIRVNERLSREGNYVSLRIRVQVETADIVLDVYEVLRQVDGVLTVM